MAKLKAPLMSLGARSQLGKALVFFPWKGIDCVREYVIPANPRSNPQITQRGYLTAAVDHWHENAYTDADRIAWNRYAGTLAKIMSGFNAMIRLHIAYIASAWALVVVSDVQIDTPTIVGFDVNVENSIAGLNLRAEIGTSKTHFPVQVALVDDADGTYSLTWGAGGSGVDYYIKVTRMRLGAWYPLTGIYHIKSA